MATPNDPQAQSLSPEQLANRLFDAVLAQHLNDPREAARKVIVFLIESIVYAVSGAAADEPARKAMLKSVGDTIASAPLSPAKP